MNKDQRYNHRPILSIQLFLRIIEKLLSKLFTN